jgi:hypothetical protein
VIFLRVMDDSCRATLSWFVIPAESKTGVANAGTHLSPIPALNVIPAQAGIHGPIQMR